MPHSLQFEASVDALRRLEGDSGGTQVVLKPFERCKYTLRRLSVRTIHVEGLLVF